MREDERSFRELPRYSAWLVVRSPARALSRKAQTHPACDDRPIWNRNPTGSVRHQNPIAIIGNGQTDIAD